MALTTRVNPPVHPMRRLAAGLSLLLLFSMGLASFSTPRFALADGPTPIPPTPVPPTAGVAATHNSVRIGLGRNQTQIGVSATGPFQVVDSQGKVVLDGAPNQVVTFTRVSVAKDAQGKDIYMIQMTSDKATPLLSLPLKVVPKADAPDNFARYKLQKWRGTLELLWNSQGTVSVVNVIPMDEYLRGVVPKEMPAGWPAEALNAQAIVARTYAVANSLSGKFDSEGFDMTNDTDSQMYGGVNAEESSTDAAVASTLYQVATYQGKPITAFYFSASGGFTENNEEVWQGGAPVPYLRGVKDFDLDSPWTKWTREPALSEVSKGVLDTRKVELGTLYDVRPLGPYGASGRPGRWELVGSNGSITLTAESMRSVANLPSHPAMVVATETTKVPITMTVPDGTDVTVVTAAGMGQISLKGASVLGAGAAVSSASAKVTMTTAPQTVPTKVAFLGGGWGHRVGMSQWGARGMALQGRTAREIVTYYFQGTQVSTLP